MYTFISPCVCQNLLTTISLRNSVGKQSQLFQEYGILACFEENFVVTIRYDSRVVGR